MAYGEFYVEQQGWARWPKALIMCRKTGRPHSKSVERRRYVPESACDEESYAAGFDNGVKATLQQLDGLLMKTDSALEIQDWVDRQWKEYES